VNLALIVLLHGRMNREGLGGNYQIDGRPTNTYQKYPPLLVEQSIGPAIRLSTPRRH